MLIFFGEPRGGLSPSEGEAGLSPRTQNRGRISLRRILCATRLRIFGADGAHHWYSTHGHTYGIHQRSYDYRDTDQPF